jgi:methylenetetrahydrofolate dehydrogenase(NAD+)/5,10-methenyltetrahydrofolate cyclohydrolase
MDATTTICHRYTPPEQLKVFTKNADIIVSAAGIIVIFEKLFEK